MKAWQPLLYVLLIIPLLVLTGCGDTVTTEEQRAIFIPSEGGNPITFSPPRDMLDDGPPPMAGQEPPDQAPFPSAMQGQSIITSAKSHEISGLIPEKAEIVPLPAPQIESNVSIEEALSSSSPTGYYTELPPAMSDISQLLWAAQDITDKEETRMAPSISSAYPLVLYLITENVTDLVSGSYLYIKRWQMDSGNRTAIGPNGTKRCIYYCCFQF